MPRSLSAMREKRRAYLASVVFFLIFMPMGVYLESRFTTGFRVTFLAILFASWYGGLGPGLLATALTSISTLVFILSSSQEILGAADIIYFVTFAVLALLISILNGSLYQASQVSREYAAQREHFIAVISHEIRTPLNGVIGMTDLLERSNLTQNQREYLATLKLSAQTLMNLVNNTLDFSKLRSRAVELVNAPFSLTRVVSEVIQLNQEAARRAELELVCWMSPELPEWVSGDAGRLGQILTNLLDNAIKFTPKGAVSVSVQPRSKKDNTVEVSIEVSDTGIGMSRDFQEKVFDVFVQAAAPSLGPQKGSGLGLAICKELVAIMKGRIEMESREGEGTLFKVSLPFALPEKEVVAERPQVAQPLADWVVNEKARVLVVDDNEVNLEVLRAMLAHLGISGVFAASGEDAIRQFGQSSFDLVLLDIYMPEQSGEEVSRIMRAARPETAVIFLSADSTPTLKSRLLREGATDYLIKPVTLQALAECMAQVGIAKGDWRSLAPMRSGEQQRGLYSKYLAELPGRLGQIQALCQQGTHQELAQSVHALRSVSLVLGVKPISDICAEFENSRGEKARQSLDKLAVESVKTAIQMSRQLDALA